MLHVECRLSKIEEAFSAHIDIKLPCMFIMTESQPDSDDNEDKDENEEEAVIVHPVTEESELDYDAKSESDFSYDDIFP